ncbi:hypothetical protein EBR11_04405, partial [bacterium]|nr:hypothetical protein [bacterium]
MGQRRHNKGKKAPPELMESVDAFLAYLALERGLAKLTVQAYEDDLVRFAEHCGRAGQKSWAEVTLSSVDSWVKSLDRRGQAATSLAR